MFNESTESKEERFGMFWTPKLAKNGKTWYVNGKLDDGRKIWGYVNPEVLDDPNAKKPYINFYIDKKEEVNNGEKS